MARTAIITMVYNERVILPIWLRHYTTHCPGAVLFVIDHGSDDGSTDSVSGANVIPLPRTPFDDGDRAEFVTNLQKALLKYYEVVIYTDCDEMLVADPRRYHSLAAFLEATRAEEVIAPTGLNVHHIPDADPILDLTEPVLGQRRHVKFGVAFCKPVVVRKPVAWAPGFHWCDCVPTYREDLFMFHLHKMEIDLAMARLQKTSEMAWSKRAAIMGWSTNKIATNLPLHRGRFAAQSRKFIAAGPEPFTFSDEIERLVESLSLQNGYWCGEHRSGRFSVIPETFWHLV
jgi:hypothetical protein